MNEYLSLIEFVFQRFGPGPMLPVLNTFARELQSERLMETPWFFQLLQFFYTVTCQTAPWLQAVHKDNLKAQVESMNSQAVCLLHPSKWTLGKWFHELHGVDFAQSFIRVLRS